MCFVSTPPLHRVSLSQVVGRIEQSCVLSDGVAHLGVRHEGLVLGEHPVPPPLDTQRPLHHKHTRQHAT